MAKRMQRVLVSEVGRKTLTLGYQGENDHTQVRIGCTLVYTDYPAAEVQLVVRPPVGDLYLAAVEKDDTDVVWDITASDAAASGAGQYQLIFTSGEEIIRSAVGSIRIWQSIEPTGAAPSPAETWSQAAEAAMADTQGALLDLVRSELPEVVEGVSEDMTNSANLMALYARNMSEIEGVAQTAADVSAQTQALDEELQTAMSEIDQILESSNLSRWSRLNRPNLLHQRFWETVPMPTSDVITDVHTVPAEDATAAAETITYTIEDAAITASYQVLNKISGNYEAISSELVSVSFAAGVATVTIAAREAHSSAVSITIRICTLADARMPYGENSRYWASNCPYMDSIYNPSYRGDDTRDGITTIVVQLTGNDVIEDADGEVYNYAIQYGITANSAYDNTEKLVYSYGATGAGEYEAGQKPPNVYGEVPMEVGRTYTLSCWARVTSGDGAIVKFGWGGNNGISWGGSATTKGESDFVEVSGSTWQRVHWTFTFAPTGAQFTDTQSGTTIKRVCNWRKRVAFMVGRKYTATLQLCGFRLVAGNLEINTRYDELKEMILALEERVAALEG